MIQAKTKIESHYDVGFFIAVWFAEQQASSYTPSIGCVVKVPEVIQGLYESNNGVEHVRTTS